MGWWCFTNTSYAQTLHISFTCCWLGLKILFLKRWRHSSPFTLDNEIFKVFSRKVFLKSACGLSWDVYILCRINNKTKPVEKSCYSWLLSRSPQLRLQNAESINFMRTARLKKVICHDSFKPLRWRKTRLYRVSHNDRQWKGSNCSCPR
jgi:hypothetical protein